MSSKICILFLISLIISYQQICRNWFPLPPLPLQSYYFIFWVGGENCWEYFEEMNWYQDKNGILHADTLRFYQNCIVIQFCLLDRSLFSISLDAKLNSNLNFKFHGVYFSFTFFIWPPTHLPPTQASSWKYKYLMNRWTAH